MKNGLFINTFKDNCSIYESGLMIYNALKQDNYNLTYLEVGKKVDDLDTIKNTNIPDDYDFFVINWHHWKLPFTEEQIKNLHGLKIGVVLEVGVVDTLELTPDWFDVYMVIDPTKEQTKTLYPFPRPLELSDNIKEQLPGTSIGSFGLYMGDKKFEEIIQQANQIKNCIVRINLPGVGVLWENEESQRLLDYAKWLKTFAKKTIDLRITHNYMSKEELIGWCSEHTLNAFPYYRNQPGLSATTDQAITSGRALAVTSCNAFRHIHKYIPYFPQQDYRKLMTSTLEGVKRMQEDWHPRNFVLKFNELLTDYGVI